MLHTNLVVKFIIIIVTGAPARAPLSAAFVKFIVIIVTGAPTRASLSAASVVPVANTSSVAADTTIGAVAVPVTRPVSRAWTRPKDASRGTALEAAAAVTVGLALTPFLT